MIGYAFGTEEWTGYGDWGFARAERVGFVEENAWKDEVASGGEGHRTRFGSWSEPLYI